MQIILAIIVAVPTVYIASFLFIGPLINDVKVSLIERRYAKINLPAQTEIVEVVAFCGNTSGAGNHVEIWAGVLIRSALPAEEIETLFRDHHTVWALSAKDAQDLAALEIYRESFYNKFPYLKDGGDKTGCYIVADTRDAVTQNDIRGH